MVLKYEWKNKIFEGIYILCKYSINFFITKAVSWFKLRLTVIHL